VRVSPCPFVGQLSRVRAHRWYRPACVPGRGSLTIDRKDESAPKDCREEEPDRRVSVVAKSGSHPVEKREGQAAEDERQTGGSMHAHLATATFGSVQVSGVTQTPEKNWERSKLF